MPFFVEILILRELSLIRTLYFYSEFYLLEGRKLNDKNGKDTGNKETWKLWDIIFTSGLFSFLKDSQEARNDDKKFKKMLLQILFGIIFTVILFAIGFWILS